LAEAEAGSGEPLEAAAVGSVEPAGGGVGGTWGAGSVRNAGVSPPLSLGASTLAASVLPLVEALGGSGLTASSLVISALSLSSIAGSSFCGSSLAEGTSSVPGLLRLLRRLT